MANTARWTAPPGQGVAILYLDRANRLTGAYMNCPHCDTEVSVHPATRCLDAWVGEVVIELQGVGLHLAGGFRYLYAHDMLHSVPNYSTDISAAWEVVEKVNQDNAMTLRWYNPDGRTSLFSVAFGFGIKSEAEAKTAPLAICRAAIKANQ